MDEEIDSENADALNFLSLQDEARLCNLRNRCNMP